jgi:hypothetical protein
MSNQFIVRKATKKAKKLKIGVSASSGSGKTYSSLKIAYGLVGDWDKICVIDSERDSASLYADLGPFNTINLTKPYHPDRYVAALVAAVESGAEVVIIDSITHEWNGPGGCLEIQSSLGGRFQDWAVVTPLHNNFIDMILTAPVHIICTIRRKEEYALGQGANGKMQVQKLGLGEVTRDGFSYEMDVMFEVENDTHNAKATKDRTQLFTDRTPFLITEETGKELKDWSNAGRSELDDAMDLVRKATEVATLDNLYDNHPSLRTNEDFMTSMKKKRSEIEELNNKK